MVFSLGLMWHLKDYGIFRKLQCSDFSGSLAESDTVIQNKCAVYVQWEKSATKSSHNVSLIFDDVFSQYYMRSVQNVKGELEETPFPWEPVVAQKYTIFSFESYEVHCNRKSKFRN